MLLHEQKRLMKSRPDTPTEDTRSEDVKGPSSDTSLHDTSSRTEVSSQHGRSTSHSSLLNVKKSIGTALKSPLSPKHEMRYITL